MITIIELINISITSYRCDFLCMVRTLYIYSLRKYQIYNIVLLAIIIPCRVHHVKSRSDESQDRIKTAGEMPTISDMQIIPL